MARWRLMEPHYLKVPDIRWEYQETDRNTGRQKRMLFEVPGYFHPDDPSLWNVMEGRDYGYIAVSDGHNNLPGDVIFKGNPTPGMLPLDDEAKAISAKFSGIWNAPDHLMNPNENSWADKMVDGFMQQADRINMKLTEISAAPVAGMAEFMQVMTNVMEQNQQILMAMTAKQIGATQVVDDLEPLEPAESAEPPPRRVGRRL